MRGLIVGAARPNADDPIGRAVAAAEAADVVVVVVGTNADWETEGEDRTSLDLPGEQNELVKRVAAVNGRTVVVVNAGSPVAMPWLDEVAAVMQVWFPGEEFGEALADMLLGVAEPGGRLPITIPKRLEDTPAFAFYPSRHDTRNDSADDVMQYGEGLLIGHRWYDAHAIEPVFPFGYGLGYTTWEFAEATLSGEIATGVTVCVPVRNTGVRAGGTTVQCYIEPLQRQPGRPVRTLQSFARVHAAAGEEVEATMELDARSFGRWDVAGHGWSVAAGDYAVLVGSSSRALTRVGVCRALAPG